MAQTQVIIDTVYTVVYTLFVHTIIYNHESDGYYTCDKLGE